MQIESIRFELKISNSKLNEFEFFNRIQIINEDCSLIKNKILFEKEF